MYPEVAPRMIPRIAKWIFRDVNMDRISDFGLRISGFGYQRDSGQSPQSAIRNPKSFFLSLLLCLLRVRFGFLSSFGGSLFLGDGFLALEARRSGLLCGLD